MLQNVVKNSIIASLNIVFSFFITSCDPGYRLYVENRTDSNVIINIHYVKDSEAYKYYKELLYKYEINEDSDFVRYEIPTGKHLVGGFNIVLPLEKQIPYSKLIIISRRDTIAYDNIENFSKDLKMSKGNSCVFIIKQ